MIGVGQIGRIGGAYARLGGFSPSILFAGSAPGAWYEYGDTATLFQDRFGSVPVTAAGQPVGMFLDKRLGLVPGAEVVANGDFSGGTTGWTVPAGWAIGGGVATATATSASLLSTSPVVAGRYYRVEFDITSYTSGSLFVRVGTGTGFSTTGTGRRSFILLANNTAGVEFYGGTVTASIDNVSVRELPGFHAVAPADGSRALYQVDGTGRGHLVFDGVDDGYSTATITPGTDKVQVFAGVRKLSDAARGMLVELGNNALNSTRLEAPQGATPSYAFGSGGSTIQAAIASSFAAPDQAVLTGIGDIAVDTCLLRRNGVQIASNPGDQGTGNYGPHQLFIGRRGGSSLPFNGRLYGLITRFGPNLSADQIAATESWMNARTGAF